MNRLEPEVYISFPGTEYLTDEQREEVLAGIGRVSQQVATPVRRPKQLRRIPALIVCAVRFLLYRGES